MQPCPYKNCGARYACSPPASVIGWQTSYMIMRKCMRRRKNASQEERLTPYTMEELHARIDRSRANIKAGRVRTTEEVRRMIESKHPWLCE